MCGNSGAKHDTYHKRTKSYHLSNRLGTTLALASAAQALTDTYRWNAWGVELASTGSTTNPFGYVGALGYYRQPDTGDYWVTARAYCPLGGRFLSPDPFCHARPSPARANCYAYGDARPTALVDPSGLLFFLAGCGPSKPPPPPPPPKDPCDGLTAGHQEECCGLKYERCLLDHGRGIASITACENCLKTCLTNIAAQPGARASVNFARRTFDVCIAAILPLPWEKQ